MILRTIFAFQMILRTILCHSSYYMHNNVNILTLFHPDWRSNRPSSSHKISSGHAAGVVRRCPRKSQAVGRKIPCNSRPSWYIYAFPVLLHIFPRHYLRVLSASFVHLLGAIKRKRSKDTLILSAVIAACTLFLIIYWLSKWWITLKWTDEDELRHISWFLSLYSDSEETACQGHESLFGNACY